MGQQWATIIGASITGTITLIVAVLAYVFGRFQKEFEVRYTRLYEDRAEVVGKLYSLVHAVSKRFEGWLSAREEYGESYPAEGQLDEQSSAIEHELRKFHEYYMEHDIWISKQTWDKLDELHRQLDEKWLSVELPKRGEDAREEVQDWVENRFPKLRDELKSEFLKVLRAERSQKRPDGEVVLKGHRRMIVGLLGTSLIGFGVGVVLSLLLKNWLVGITAGLAVGLGIGLLLEYVNPSREQRS